MTMDIMAVTPATTVASTMEEAIIGVDTIATAATLDPAAVVVFATLPSPAVGATAAPFPAVRRCLIAAAFAVAAIVKVSIASEWDLGFRTNPKSPCNGQLPVEGWYPLHLGSCTPTRWPDDWERTYALQSS